METRRYRALRMLRNRGQATYAAVAARASSPGFAWLHDHGLITAEDGQCAITDVGRRYLDQLAEIDR
jgi:hypothetical protein